jgi:putative ABC transport system permease protein
MSTAPILPDAFAPCQLACADGPMIGGMGDVRLALRALARSPGFTAAAVLTLGLGIGAVTSVWSVVYGVLLRPLPYHEPALLVLVEGTRSFAGEARRETFTARDVTDWQRAASLVSLAGYADVGRALDARDGLEPVTNTLVSGAFFSTLGTPPLAGRLPDAGDDRSAIAVISHRLWLRLFDGRADAIGSGIRLGDREYAIVGVAAAGFRFPSDRVDVWTPMGEAQEGGVAPFLASRRGGGVTLVARLRPGVTLDAARAELRVHAQHLSAERGETGPVLEPVVTTLADVAAGGVGPALRLFLGATGLLLLVAVANVTNLTIARQAARARGLAVRLALGASRGRLLAHAAVEGVLIGAAGGIAGLLLAAAAVRTLVWWAPPQLPRLDAVRVDAPVLAVAAAAGLLATLLAALLPALHAARQDAARALGAGVRSTGPTGAARGRALLVGAELAVCIVLLVGTAVLTRSFVRLLQVQVGARTDDVLVARLDLSLGRTLDEPHQRALGAALVAESRALPGVVEAAIGTSLPPNGQMVQLTLKDLATARGVIPEYAAVAAPASPGYFAALGIPLLEGRVFEEGDDLSRGRVLVVSADVAQDLFGGRALGRTFTLPTPRDGNVTATVVGVVGNVRYGGLTGPTQPTLYVPFAQQPWPTAFLLVRTAGSPAAVAESLRQAIGAVDRRVGVVSIRTLDDVLSQETAQPAFRTAVLLTTTGACVVLAAIGLAGVVGYSVARRTAEIGVRMALGAGQRDIAWMVLGEAARLGAAGGAVGLAAAAAGTRLLAGHVFGVSPGDPASFLMAAALLALVIVAAGAGPAWRASRVDPVVALRAE